MSVGGIFCIATMCGFVPVDGDVLLEVVFFLELPYDTDGFQLI